MIYLKDKDNVEFVLSNEVWFHIQKFHPEIKDTETIEQILKTPDAIVESNWDHESYLYYKSFGKLYRVVVVHLQEKRIKTTLTVRTIKKGNIAWINPKLMK